MSQATYKTPLHLTAAALLPFRVQRLTSRRAGERCRSAIMPYTLECAQSFSADASEMDINRAFNDWRIRGEYIILTAPDGSFLQAAGELDGPYILEHRRAATKEHVRATGELTLEEVRTAFLQYRRGDMGWQAARNWEPINVAGCLSSTVLAVGLIGAIVAVTAQPSATLNRGAAAVKPLRHACPMSSNWDKLPT